MENEKSKEDKYPSVDLGYEIAKESYRVASQRFDVVNNGIDRTLTWMLSFNLGFIAIIYKDAHALELKSWWFYSAMIVFLLSVVLGLSTKYKRLAITRSPKVIFEEWLHKTEWEFKKDSIYYAGKNYINNKRVIDRNGVISDLIIFLFLIEIILMAVWATQ